MYNVKCDECKTPIGETDSASINAAGGLCHACKIKISKLQQRARFNARVESQFKKAETGEVIDLTELMIRAERL